MKSGDLVRFRAPHYLAKTKHLDADGHGEWLVGLLIEYHTWEKMATVLYKDRILRLIGRNVEKFGKKGLPNESNII